MTHVVTFPGLGLELSLIHIFTSVTPWNLMMTIFL